MLGNALDLKDASNSIVLVGENCMSIHDPVFGEAIGKSECSTCPDSVSLFPCLLRLIGISADQCSCRYNFGGACMSVSIGFMFCSRAVCNVHC